MDSGPSSSKEACGRSVRGGWATEWFVSLVAVCTCGPHAFTAVYFPLFFLVSYLVLGEAQWSTPIHLPTPTPSASPVSSSPRTAVASTPAKGRPPLQFPSSKLQADRGSLRWIQDPRRRIDLISNQIELPNGASSALAPYFFLLSPLLVSPLTKRPSRGLHPTVREARCHRGRRPVGQATWGWTSRRSAAGWQESYVLRSTVGEARGACCLLWPWPPPPARSGALASSIAPWRPAGGRLLQRCGGPVTTH